MRHARGNAVLLLGLLALSGGAHGAWLESFEALSAVSPAVLPAADNSQLPGGSFSLRFAPPGGSLVADGTSFPGNLNAQHLAWTGATNQSLDLQISPPLLGSAADGILRVAIAIRIDNWVGNGTDTIDVLYVGRPAGRQFALEIREGVLRMVADQLPGLAITSTLGSDGEWLVLAGWVQPGTAATGKATWWAVDEQSHELLASATGITFAAAASEISRLGFFASINSPSGSATAISLDELRVYTAEDAATPAAFLRRVRSDYFPSPPDSPDIWELF